MTFNILPNFIKLVKITELYKVIDIINNQYFLKDVINGTSSLYGLLDGGTFYTPDALNRWGYIHNLKMTKNLVRSGLLKGIYLKDNLIKTYKSWCIPLSKDICFLSVIPGFFSFSLMLLLCLNLTPLLLLIISVP